MKIALRSMAAVWTALLASTGFAAPAEAEGDDSCAIVEAAQAHLIQHPLERTGAADSGIVSSQDLPSAVRSDLIALDVPFSDWGNAGWRGCVALGRSQGTVSYRISEPSRHDNYAVVQADVHNRSPFNGMWAEIRAGYVLRLIESKWKVEGAVLIGGGSFLQE